MFKARWSRLNYELFLMVTDSARRGQPVMYKMPECRITPNFIVPNQ